jgi:CrcB protein
VGSIPILGSMTFYNLLIVGLGGFLGSIARFVTGRMIDEKMNAVFHYGTLTVNLVGSFIVGFVYTLAIRKGIVPEHWRLFLGVGFCGGFTTFSAFAWENMNLLQQKLVFTSILYISVSLVAGIFAVVAGSWCSRFL